MRYKREKRMRKGYFPTEIYPLKIGTPMGIRDKTGTEICAGDIVSYSRNYRGRVLTREKKYAHMYLDYSLRNHPFKQFNHNSYGKMLYIPLDNGARMELEIL